MYVCRDDGETYLTDQYDSDSCQELTRENVLQVTTLEELADYCDQDAESYNNHSYVGAHRVLSALLFRQLGREQAALLLFEIAERGGLDGMGGVGGKSDSFSEFGIQDCWKDWKLPAENK